MSQRVRVAGVLLVVAWVLASTHSTHAASWFEKNFWLSGPRYDGALPPCDHPAALERIQWLFGIKEQRFWNSYLAITAFGPVYEIDFRPWAPDTIPRRFCTGVALTSDGIQRPLYFSIGEDTGLIGVSWDVELCVVGVDRNWAFNPACKMARP